MQYRYPDNNSSIFKNLYLLWIRENSSGLNIILIKGSNFLSSPNKGRQILL